MTTTTRIPLDDRPRLIREGFSAFCRRTLADHPHHAPIVEREFAIRAAGANLQHLVAIAEQMQGETFRLRDVLSR